MELTIGKKSCSEMAEWFGIRPDSFSKHKQIKLDELKFFAKFHLEKKKIVIEEVYIPIYSKASVRVYNRIKTLYLEVWNDGEYGLDLANRVASIVQKKLKQEFESYTNQESTTYKLVLQAIKEDFGTKGSSKGGEKGRCWYRLAKQDVGTGKLIPFTEEEEKIKKKLMQKYFGGQEEEKLHLMKQHEDGEISDAEFAVEIKEMSNYSNVNYFAFLADLGEALECVIKRGTHLEPSAF